MFLELASGTFGWDPDAVLPAISLPYPSGPSPFKEPFLCTTPTDLTLSYNSAVAYLPSVISSVLISPVSKYLELWIGT